MDGVEQTVEETVEETRKHVEPGYLEAVYHLFSVAKKHGPVVLRMRTENRSDQVELPSLTPIWRSAEFQEREVFDLYGIVFKGHPDLRRLLMWDEFKDHPMRRDYVEPDDFEYEPTPHDKVLARAQAHKSAVAAGEEKAMNSLGRSRRKSRRAGIGRRSSSRMATVSCLKWRWGRIIPQPTAFSAWISRSMASA